MLLHLAEADWPEADRQRFVVCFDRQHDVFDDHGGGSHLKRSTKVAIRYSYRRWLGWISACHPELLDHPPEFRANPDTIRSFVKHLRSTCSPRTVATQIGKLYDGFRHMYPEQNWSWLRLAKSRLECAIPKLGRKPILITSQQLIDASLHRLAEVDRAFLDTATNLSRRQLQVLALAYRDALLVAFEAFLPLRRSNAADLRIGHTLLRETTGVWRVHLQQGLTKNGETIDGDLPKDISTAVDRFVTVYRPLIFQSHDHDGLWATAKGQPATGDALYNAARKEIRRSLGLELTLHDLRRIGVTTWCIHDPVNAAGAKDLLGDRSDRVIAENYNLANGITASRRMAALVRKLKGGYGARTD